LAPDRYSRLKTLFAGAAELAPAERGPWLQARCEDDATLAAEVLELARCNDLATRGASAVPLRAAADWLAPPPPAPVAGDVLGRWRLQQEIGAGGMGRVWRAERVDGHFRQQAALKVMEGRPSPEALAAMGRERQILADLSHPHIARLLDGGSGPDGRPYLVMEYIDGWPLDRYCAQRELSLQERLALWLDVCDAIFFAHQHLVIHCDLKPGNVLVDRAGRAVVLDFGIARLLRALDADGRQGMLAFTPGFASPEQERDEMLTTASDIFALGRLLQTLTDGQARGLQARELQAILALAMAPRAEDCYSSAGLMASDVRRLLQGRPVRALGGSRLYQARRQLTRHPVVALSVLAGALVFAAFAQRVHEEHRAAVEALAEAARVRDRLAAAEAAAAACRLSCPAPASPRR
jgi:eukaryotic-like serine/threonine-protein kinase